MEEHREEAGASLNGMCAYTLAHRSRRGARGFADFAVFAVVYSRFTALLRAQCQRT